jgi:predicted O-linked N-acetylglucosamine transferase (SPINDLY family)
LNADAPALDAPRLFDQAAQLLAARDYSSAFNCILKSLAQDRSHVESWDMLARLQLQLDQGREAVRSASIAVRLAPQRADYRYSLGRALKASGRIDEAIEQYRQAIHLDATRAHYFCSLGIALRARGQLAEAILSYQAALALEPRNREVQNNLANALRDAGRPQEAAGYAAATTALSTELGRLIDEAATLHAAASFDQAMQRWSDVIRLAPDSALAHHGYAATLNELHLFAEGLQHEERALALEPNHLGALDGAFKLAWLAGEVDKVVRYGERLDALRPAASHRIICKLALPVIQESAESIAATRRRYEAGLDELLATPVRIEQPHLTVRNLGFYLAYHGENNRALQEKFGRLMLQSCPELSWVAPHCRGYRRSAQRLRVGFASELMRDHSIGKTSAGLIAQLDRAQFEVFALNLPGHAKVEDATQRWIRQRCDHWLTFDGGPERTRIAIADLKLDILFYQDIGMVPFSYFLAFSRLAPLQCVSFGHPDTTGIPNLDHFVSNDLYEPLDALEHYTENLFLLHDLPTLAYYYRPPVPRISITRSELGFTESDHLYVCAQTLFKLHPEFDPILAGILARDPAARIVLINGQYQGWTEQLMQRFRRAMGPLAQRITFVGRMDRERYLALLRLSDVALDTIHFNGMNSSLEALAMGTPVVTWPGRLQRGRHTQAMYRRMELSECVAGDVAAYVDIAVRIGTEPDCRQALSRSILDRSPVLFENQRVVQEFERFFQQALPARLD